MKKLLPLIIIVVLFASCASLKVKVNTSHTGGLAIDTLYLVSTMIGPVVQPVIPLIDAAAFNAKTNKIADQILDEQQKSVDNFRSILVNVLEQELPVVVVTGNEFDSDPAGRYKVRSGIQVDNKNFPMAFFGEGDMNMIDLGKGRNVVDIFKDNTANISSISRFASDLGISNVVLSFSRLNILSVGMFGGSGNIRLETFLYVYGADGELLLDAYAWSKFNTINGRELSQYKYELTNFNPLIKLIVQELKPYIK
jgi:hypothetical protein